MRYESMDLESNKLVIRKSVFSDCNYFAKWENKEYVKEFFTMEDTRDYEEIAQEFVLNNQDNSKIQFTILLKESMIPIGRIYITRYDKYLQSLDITRIYIGEEKYLGKGFGKESMKLLLKYLFEELNIERITLDTFDGNIKGDNLYKSLGFVDEGIMRHSTKKKNKFYDLHLKSMLKSEYKENML